MRAQMIVGQVAFVFAIPFGADVSGAVPREQSGRRPAWTPHPPAFSTPQGTTSATSNNGSLFRLTEMPSDSYCKDSTLSDAQIMLNDEGSRSSNPQFRPNIGMAMDGGFVIVWNDLRHLTMMLLAQRYDSIGERIGCELPVAVYPEFAFGGRRYDDLQAKVAVNVGGSFVVTWEQDFRVYARLFGADGAPQSDPITVLDPEGVGYAYNPAVTILLFGEFVIVWEDERNGYHDDIFGQMFDATGHPIGDNFKISNDTTGREQWNSAVASDTDGRFYVVWQDGLLEGNPQGYGASDIYYQSFNSDGNAVGPNKRISDSAQSRLFDRPCIVSDASGNCTVLWRNLDRTLRLCRLSNNGVSTYGTKDPIDGGTAYGNGDTDPLALSLGNDGGVTVAWVRRREPRSLYDIYARYIDSSGSAKGSSFPVMASDTSGLQFESSPAVATDRYGQSAFVWSHDTVNQATDIRVIRLDSLNRRLSEPNQVNRDGSWQYEPSVAVGQDGDVSIAWVDTRFSEYGGGYAVVLQRLDGTGSRHDANIQLTPGNGFAYNPRVSFDSLGNTIVFWHESDSLYMQIKTCRVERLTGMPGPTTTIVIDTSYTMDDLDVSTYRQGGVLVWAVTYFEASDVKHKIKAQRISSDGLATGPFIAISDASGHRDPTIAIRHDGIFAIAWESNAAEIFVQVFDSFGLHLTTPIGLGDSLTYGIVSRSRPDIGVDSDGNFMVVWFESSTTETAIMSRAIAPDGSLGNSPKKTMASTERPQNYSPLQLVSTRDGRLAVVWDRVLNSGGNQIMCQFIGQSGDPEGGPIEISHPASPDYLPMYPSACYTNGRLFVAWQSNRRGWDSDIWGRHIDLTPTAVEDEQGVIPASFAVHQNYPNPFNASTVISFELRSPAQVTVTVVNALGQQVRQLLSGRMSSGTHHLLWDGTSDAGHSVASGMYFYRVSTGELELSKKMLMIK